MTKTITSPVPMSINGHLMTTEDLNPKSTRFSSDEWGEYAMDAKFHHVHIPIFLDKINQVADKAIIMRTIKK
jgi:hypothetical protein